VSEALVIGERKFHVVRAFSAVNLHTTSAPRHTARGR
jgi:hypothetical protein